MDDPPSSAFAMEDDSSACEPLGVAKLERDKDDTRCERLNAEIKGREAVKGRAARGVSAYVAEHFAKCRIDRGAPGDAPRHARSGMKDRRGIGEGGAKRLPLEILERDKESTQRTGHGRRVAANRTRRLGTKRKGKA
jgi:hypothetical protein